MKILRICVYVVLRLLWDIPKLMIFYFASIITAPVLIYEWAEHGRFEKSEVSIEWYDENIPFYTTIKTIKQIWRS